MWYSINFQIIYEKSENLKKLQLKKFQNLLLDNNKIPLSVPNQNYGSSSNGVTEQEHHIKKANFFLIFIPLKTF